MIINWSGYEWLTRERWGIVHPDKGWNWYDPSCVNVHNGVLNLDIKYNPKTFVIDDTTIYSTYGTGLICCESDFDFGTFEIKAKLPEGTGLWPAFWVYPSNAHPPEIDIFEGYSGERDYKSRCFLKPYRVESCTHSRIKADKPVRKPWFWQLPNPYKNFNTYTLKWSADELAFLINGKTIRRITNKKTLKELAGYKMRIIINNHIEGRFLNKFNIKSPFIIEYFKYNKLTI